MIRLTGISHAFGGTQVLRNIDLDIPQSGFVSLLGPSGCGKTTLLRILAGFIRPDAGAVAIGDEVLSGPGRFVEPEQRDMGMVFQTFAVWPHLTVFENIAFGLRLRKVAPVEVRARTQEALNLVKLDGFGARYPTQLSGGQRQRVAIARSIVVRPRVLLLDEPLSSLDTALRHEMLHELRALQRALGIAFVYVTHDQSEALMASDRVVVLNGGAIEQQGPPRTLFDLPASRFVASFITNASVLDGQVASLDDRYADISLADGSTVRCRTAGPQAGLATATRVHLCVRPDAGRFDQSGSSTALPAHLVDTRFGGALSEFAVTLAGAPLRLSMSTDGAPASGPVRLMLDPDKCIAFAAGD
jgi:ABC-type Fe3+/spermidine/putrescine transport system ATPase subunit